MRLISQDGMRDFPYSQCIVAVEDRCIVVLLAGAKLKVTIATYSSEEKAKKALRKTQMAYDAEERTYKFPSEALV